MSEIEIQKISIVDLNTDAIVNAANEYLAAGGGVCGAIFQAAGYQKLQSACDLYGHCNTGDAVITPGFALKAKYVIHAVGPRWRDGKHGEPEQLRSAYKKALELAAENHCRSVGFPLISAGIYGYPVESAWSEAIRACAEFLQNHREQDIRIVFAVLNDSILAVGKKELLDNLKGNRQTAVDKLQVGDVACPAIYFHKPEEPNGYLSNWYRSPFDLMGMHFTSAEQFIMYQKCSIFGDSVSAEQILSTDDTALQQAIGRKSKGYIDSVWDGMRQAIVVRGLLAKFRQNPELRQKLLDTGEAYLVECAVSDKTWACGISLYDDQRRDVSNWKGKNILGFALMTVRSVLQEQI